MIVIGAPYWTKVQYPLSVRSAKIVCVIELYRRRKDSPDSEWHFHTQCPDWPKVDYTQTRFLKPESKSASVRSAKGVRPKCLVLSRARPQSLHYGTSSRLLHISILAKMSCGSRSASIFSGSMSGGWLHSFPRWFFHLGRPSLR